MEYVMCTSGVSGLLFSLFSMMAVPVAAPAQPACEAPALSQEQVKAIIAKERAVRKDLPAPFADYQVQMQREGCHYVYIERGLPLTPDKQNTFRLNQRGVIVDTQPPTLACPKKEFTEQELGDIVRQARTKRSDLPPPFEKTRVRVERTGCLYYYFEYAVPETRGNFQTIVIDPLGEVMNAIRSKPY